MIALAVSLLFAAAFFASVWAMWATIAPRLGYMRALILGEVPPVLVEERERDTIIRIERRAR